MREARRRFAGRSRWLSGGLGAVLAVAATACGDSEPPLGGGGGGGRTFVTTYTVTASGDGQLTEVRYNNGLGGMISGTIAGSTWTTQVNMDPGDQISLTVIGTVTNGDIIASMSSDDGVGAVVSDSDTCTASGSQTDCDIQLPVQTLP